MLTNVGGPQYGVFMNMKRENCRVFINVKEGYYRVFMNGRVKMSGYYPVFAGMN